MNLDGILMRAAFSAGVLLRDGAFSDLAIEWKPGNSPVTNMDKAAELLIREVIEKELGHRPDFLGEEYGVADNGSRYRFIIDPIDGTKQYIRREFSTSVSIAAETDGALSAACVYDFMRDIAFVVGEGEPYLLHNGSKHGFRHETGLQKTYAIVYAFDKVPRLMELVSGSSWDITTRAGSVALAMAQTASGAYDCMIEGPKNYGPHDVAAGYLLLKRGGFTVDDSQGNPFDYLHPQNGIVAMRRCA